MKLIRFLNEGGQPADIDEVKKKCKSMIKFYDSQSSSMMTVFWRGVKSRPMSDVAKYKSHLTKRKPMSTGVHTHNFLNEYFEKAFGWPARNGVASTGNAAEAASYGFAMIFLPTDPFEFVWSPKVKDLWAGLPMDFAGLGRGGYADKTVEDWLAETDGVIGRDREGNHRWKMENVIMPMLGTYTNGYHGSPKDLLKAVESRHEVLFKCKEYYMLDYKAAIQFKWHEIRTY